MDGEGRALRPAILGMDTRTTAENEWLAETFGADEPVPAHRHADAHDQHPAQAALAAAQRAGDLASGRSIPALRGLLPAAAGRRGGDQPCLASRTQMMDLADGRLGRTTSWTLRHRPRAGWRRRPLPAAWWARCARIWRATGARRRGAAGERRARPGLRGAGQRRDRPGLAMVSTGTAEVVEVAMASPALGAGLARRRHLRLPPRGARPVPGHDAQPQRRAAAALVPRHVAAGGNAGGGSVTGGDAYDLILAGAPDGPTGLLVLPHFAGSGTPWLDTTSKGAILGLTFATDRGGTGQGAPGRA